MTDPREVLAYCEKAHFDCLCGLPACQQCAANALFESSARTDLPDLARQLIEARQESEADARRIALYTSLLEKIGSHLDPDVTLSQVPDAVADLRRRLAAAALSAANCGHRCCSSTPIRKSVHARVAAVRCC